MLKRLAHQRENKKKNRASEKSLASQSLYEKEKNKLNLLNVENTVQRGMANQCRHEKENKCK